MRILLSALLAVCLLSLPTAAEANQGATALGQLERKTLKDGRAIILTGGKAFTVNPVGVRRQMRMNGTYKTTDGMTLTVNSGYATLKRQRDNQQAGHHSGSAPAQSAR